MSEITLFTFQDRALRITDVNGEPWFVLKDVLSAMGSSRHTTQAIASVNQTLGKGYISDVPLQTKGGVQSTTIAAEPAVTFLVSRSNTDDGRRLNRFIHATVLPSLRKTGSYHINPPPAAPISPPPAGRLIADGRYIELLEAENALLKQRQAPVAPVVTTPQAARAVTAEEAAEILERVTAGESTGASARAMGRHPRTIGRVLARAERGDPQMALRLLDLGESA